VQLMASPAPSWQFAGWSGDTTSSANPLALTMTADRTLTATFTIDSYTLNVTTVGNGNVTKTPDQPTYDSGTSLQLLALSATGWHFYNWSATRPASAIRSCSR